MFQTSSLQTGFTLVEILVVMVIASLLAGIVTPRLYHAAQRIEISSQRDQILVEIAALGYRAYAYGRPIELQTIYSNQAIPDSYPLSIPAGWNLEIAEPIHFDFHGICSGGKITLISPDKIREVLQLRPPLCKIASRSAP